MRDPGNHPARHDRRMIRQRRTVLLRQGQEIARELAGMGTHLKARAGIAMGEPPKAVKRAHEAFGGRRHVEGRAIPAKKAASPENHLPIGDVHGDRGISQMDMRCKKRKTARTIGATKQRARGQRETQLQPCPLDAKAEAWPHPSCRIQRLTPF